MKRSLIAVTVAALVLSACGSSSDGADETTTTLDAETASSLLPGALEEAEAARVKFCEDTRVYLDELDTYGGVWSDQEATVGDVTGGVDNLKPAKNEAESALSDLETAVGEYQRLEAIAAPPEGADPDLEAQEAKVEALLEDVTAAEDNLTEVSDGITEDTALIEASVDFTTAAFSVQVAWLRVFTATGCLDDNAEAVEALTNYIKALQADLAAAGYYTGPADGSYGAETTDAVKALQADAGLTETGLIDPATQVALAEKLEELGQSESLQIAALQGALKAAGYYDGPVDGVWSDQVEAAVKALQADLGLPEDGELDPATIQALLDALQKAFDAGANSTTTTEAPATTTVPEATTTTGG